MSDFDWQCFNGHKYSLKEVMKMWGEGKVFCDKCGKRIIFMKNYDENELREKWGHARIDNEHPYAP